MARFRFPLEAVLDQRERVERERQRDVAELEARRLEIESAIRADQQMMARERAEQAALLSAGDVAGVRRQATTIVRVDARARARAVELAGVLKRLEAARMRLLDAAKQRRAVELLRERRLEEWKLEQSRLEAAAVDELAVMRFGREVTP